MFLLRNKKNYLYPCLSRSLDYPTVSKYFSSIFQAFYKLYQTFLYGINPFVRNVLFAYHNVMLIFSRSPCYLNTCNVCNRNATCSHNVKHIYLIMVFAVISNDGWMTCDFTSFSTVFQSYQDNGRMIMKDCVQWNPV